MRNGGRGRGRVAGAGGLEERLLQNANLSSEEAIQLDASERRGVRVNVALLVVLAVLDVAAVAGNRDGMVPSGGFDYSRDLSDVALLVLLRSLALSASGILVMKSPRFRVLISVGYWLTFSWLIYGTGKLIAFNWASDADVVQYVSLFGWLAFGVAELAVLTRLQHWAEERARWAISEVDASGDEEGGSGSGTSAVGGISIGSDRVRVKKLDPSSANGKAAAKPFWSASLWRVLKPYFWPKGYFSKFRCFLTWAFLGLSKASNLMSPIYLGRAVQELSDKGVSEKQVYGYVVTYCALVLASKVLKEMQNVVYLKVKQTAYVQIAEQTFRHLHSLSLEWHLKKKMGNVLRSMDRGVNAADTLVTYLFLYLAPSVAECVVVFVIFYSHFNIPTVSATAYMSFAAYSVLTVQITLWRKKFREKTNKHDNDYHDKATDSLINYETVKYFTAEEFEIARYTDSIFKFQAHSVNTSYSLSLLNTTQNVIIQLCTAVSLCLAANEVRHGRLEVGQFVSVAAYVGNLFAPLSFLGSVYNAVIQSIVDMTNLSDLLQEEPDLVDAPNARALIPVPSGTEGASIEFRDVSFRYPSQAATGGIKDVSFKVEAGTTTAICGTTGAGKSTLARLLFRFYDPLAGKVLISNQDIKLVTQRSLRGAIGVVPQDTVLFNDTVRHNIAYGNFEATQEDIENACRSAQILDFILSLPDGFQTMVGERGLKLSGGEKQRVAIARCLLKNPPIVLLDEATSALDNVVERTVQEALNKLMVKRTTVVIAHRLTTIKNAEQIIVLEKGSILERGNHQQLIDADGAYARLWSSRLEEFPTRSDRVEEVEANGD